MFRGLEQYDISVLDINLNEEEHDWLSEYLDRLVRKKEHPKDFSKVIKFMCRKNKIFAHHWETSGESYLAAIYLMNLIESETTGNAFEPKRVKNRNTQRIGVYSRYTTTIMDVKKKQLGKQSI